MCSSKPHSSSEANQPQAENFQAQLDTDQPAQNELREQIEKEQVEVEVALKEVNPVNNSSSQQEWVSKQQLPFFELSSDAMCVLDEQGVCLRINPAFSNALGYSSSEIEGQSLAKLAHPEDRQQHSCVIKKIITQTSSKNFTYRYQHKSGCYLWLSWSIAIAAPAGKPSQPAEQSSAIELCCVARDVTVSQQKIQKLLAEAQAEYQEKYAEFQRTAQQNDSHIKQVRKEAQMYANVVENMQIGLYIWQLSSPGGKDTLKLIGSNPAAQSATGIDASSMIGQTIEQIFPALTNTDIPQTYIQVARSGQKRDLGEISYDDEKVEPGVFTVKAFPLSNQCVGIAFENITKRRQYELAHREQEEQLRIIFNQAGIGMARLSITGQWIQVNQKLCRLLNYSETELLEKTLFDVTHPEDRENDQEKNRATDQSLYQAFFQPLISGQQNQLTFENRCVTQNGHTIWALVTLSIVRPESVRSDSIASPYFIATIQDITDRKQTALSLENQKNDLIAVNVMLTSTMSQLEERNRELDQFAYVASHDLRSPLRAINNLAGWIEEDMGDRLPSENKAQLDLLKSRVKRMEGLINGLLEYSRVARTQQSHEQVDTAKLVKNIFASLAPPEGFTLEIAPNLPVLQAKKTPLMQIFLNLISNAIMHHDRTDGIVQISARELDQFYEFSVTDDGPGIEPAYHEKIFVIFQRLQSRDDLESSGIGLSLVKKIIKSEGGDVSVESNLGEGATFKVTWPKSPN